MSNWTEFHIQITGARADQQSLVALLQQHQEHCDDLRTPWVFNFSSVCSKERQYFWSPERWYEWEAETLVIHGEMKWMPPLIIVGKLAEMFPALTFDVISTTEHEWFEHWRETHQDSLQLIEDLIIDLREESVVRHWTREGEESVFSLPAKELPAEF